MLEVLTDMTDCGVAKKSRMLVHVLIQTVITFEKSKTHRGFCIFLPIKV